jgi:hypothetical protein
MIQKDAPCEHKRHAGSTPATSTILPLICDKNNPLPKCSKTGRACQKYHLYVIELELFLWKNEKRFRKKSPLKNMDRPKLEDIIEGLYPVPQED